MTITIMRRGCPVTYRLTIVRCERCDTKYELVIGFGSGPWFCGCGGRCWG